VTAGPRAMCGVLLVSGLAIVAGCRRWAPATIADPLMDVFRKQAQAAGLTGTQTDGKRVFDQYCVTCHGDGGAGDGQNASNLDPKPPDFRQSLRLHPASYWRQIIEGGTASVGRSPLCPPWGRNLTAAQIDTLIAYLAALTSPSSPATPPGMPSAGR